MLFGSGDLMVPTLGTPLLYEPTLSSHALLVQEPQLDWNIGDQSRNRLTLVLQTPDQGHEWDKQIF